MGSDWHGHSEGPADDGVGRPGMRGGATDRAGGTDGATDAGIDYARNARDGGHGRLTDLYFDDPDDIFDSSSQPDERRRMELDEEIDEGLTARRVLEEFDPSRANRPDIDPNEAVAHIARWAQEQPRLAPLTKQEHCVQRVYAVFGQGAFHGTERHEGAMDDQDHLLRLVERQDPAQTDEIQRAKGIDAFKKGNGKHVCADSSTSIGDSVAYAVALARGVNHPNVRAALEARHDPPKRPYYVHVPIVELLGKNGHEFCSGYQLVGDDPRQAVKERDAWAKAGWRGKPRDGLRQPGVERISTFLDGVIEFRFEHNAAKDGYELISMFPRPRIDPGEGSRRGQRT